MDAIGINIYGGGFTLGVKKHFKVLGQWEECNLGKKTFDANFKGIPRPLKLEDWPIKEFAGKIDFVFANPPCAPWSLANMTRPESPDKKVTVESRFQDKRLALTEHTMAAAIKLKPTVFISESVENAYNIGESHYEQYKQAWIKAGYAVTYFLTDAILHGSPCTRRRFHFIAHKVELVLGKQPVIETPRTVRDAIGDLAKGFGQVQGHDEVEAPANLLKLMKEMSTCISLPNAIKNSTWFTGYKATFLTKKLDWDCPGYTMVNFMFIHPDGRWITKREAARLCGYPDSFKVLNAIETVDAVIPPVAEMLATIAKKSIKKNAPIKPSFNIVDWRDGGILFRPSKYKKSLNKKI